MNKRKDIIVNLKVLETREDGGRIRINTPALDRDLDRVYPGGAQLDNYLANPVVLWGHNYREPWAIVGRTNSIEVTEDYIDVDFDLRESAGPNDPVSIVRLLWAKSYVKTASIGFMPLGDLERNDEGGFDFRTWELLEWSLVPVPANQEALRLAVKAFDAKKTIDKDRDETWIRILEVKSNHGVDQKLFAIFNRYTLTFSEDETKLDVNEDGEIEEIPHPDAGKTIKKKSVDFIPAIEFHSEKWGDDAIYSISAKDQDDDELVKSSRDEYQVNEMSDIVLTLDHNQKGYNPIKSKDTVDLCRRTKSDTKRVLNIIKRKKGVGDEEPNNDTPPNDESESPIDNFLNQLYGENES